jgi:hypothetical protein
MNVVVATSRGGWIKQKLPPGTTVSINPGSSLKTLTEIAKVQTPPPNRLPHRPFIYFIAGVPDLTEKIKSQSRNYHYCEIIFVEELETASNRFIKQLEITQTEILKHGATPIFSTITKFNLATYNLNLKLKNKTSVHHHIDFYHDMQYRLDLAIDIINTSIIRLNHRIHVATPLLHTSIIETRGKKSHRYKFYRWDFLHDGLHPSDTLLNKWAKSLIYCFNNNSSSSSSDSSELSSPDRPWRRGKRQRLN